MRIIHTADIHLDSKMESHLSKNLAQTRKLELISAFNRLCEYALEQQVYIILISGDLFDIKAPSIKTVKAIESIIRTNNDITFLYVPGNHDEFDFVQALDVVPKNLVVFGEQWKTVDFSDVSISGIVFNDKTEKYMYDTLNLDPLKKNIVMLHGDVSNYEVKGKINLQALKNKGIDYLALGHIHSYIKGEIDNRGIYVYSGCLEGRGFDECGKKGFVLINCLDDGLSHTFIKSSIRQIHELELDITDFKDYSDIVNETKKLVSNISKEDMISLTIKGEYDAYLFKPIDILENTLNDMFFFAKCKDESTLRINPTDFEGDLSLKGEFIRGVLDSLESDENKKDIIICGIKAITGGDI